MDSKKETLIIILSLTACLICWWVGLHENDKRLKEIEEHVELCGQAIKTHEYVINVLTEQYLQNQIQ